MSPCSGGKVDPELSSAGAVEYPAGSLPVIVRIAGLPGAALSSLGSPPLLALSSHLEQLHHALERTQSGLAELIASQLARFSAPERRALLAVKRDCFNHRDLTKHIESSIWHLLEELAPDLSHRQIEIQRELQSAEKSLGELFEHELQRELEAIYDHASSPRFLRGLVLSSIEVVQALQGHVLSNGDRNRKEAAAKGRRERKLDLTLLRFVTRAAAKLSPNSTLTTLALGRIEADLDETVRVLVDGRTEERSRVHLDRIYLDQLQELLLFAPEIRALCRVAINDTLQAIGSNFLHWIRPSRWHIDENNGQFLLAPLSVVRGKLDDELVSVVRHAFEQGGDCYEELSHYLSPEVLDRLIEIGLLQLLPPWSMSSVLPGERVILDFLRAQNVKDQLLCEFRQALSRLVELQDGIPASLHPDCCFLELRQQLGMLRELARLFPGAEKDLTLPSLSKVNRLFHESVFSLKMDSPAAGQAATVALKKEPLEEAYRAARVLFQFMEVFNHRHDLLHSLEHFWRAELPDDRSLPALDFFRMASPLWKEYVTFDRAQRNTLMTTFNPYNLPQLRKLEETRAQLYRAVQNRLSVVENGYQVSCQEMETILAEIPTRYRPQVWPSVLVQPLREPNGLWALNRLLEGTGRYSNRYIAALPFELGKFFADQWTTRAHVELDGERVELIDLMFVRGGTAEVHHPQTTFMLELPGDRIDVTTQRKVRLSEFRLHFDKQQGKIAIKNSDGQRLLPVHLTSLNHSLLPSIVRFISVFGPYEVRQTFPRPPRVEHGGGCLVYERVTCGRLVVSRKRWELGPEAMSELTRVAESRALPHQFYLAIQVWRERFSIPHEVYFYESIHSPREDIYHYKPQFLDLTSPLMAQLFATLLKPQTRRYIIDEALPARHDFPITPEGHRALEVQLEGIAFQHLTSRRSGATDGPRAF